MKVVIIGAGVAGLSIGWRLRQAGVAVTILDRAQPARGATWASAGMISVAGEMNDPHAAETQFGNHSSKLWPDFAIEIEAASGQTIGYRQDGALIVARTDESWRKLQSHTATELLNREQSLARQPMLTSVITGSLWAPDDAQVDNRALGDALAAAFRAAGGELVPNEAVVDVIVQSGRAVAAVTPFRHIEADTFLLAAGAWSGSFGGLPPEALPPVRPIKGEMIAVAPPTGIPLPPYVIRDERVYLVPRRDRLLIGATMREAGFDTAITREAAAQLSEAAIDLLPGLAGWDIVDHWAGLRPGSPDGLPVLGETAVSNFYVASGQFRNGILFAPAIAEHLSRLILKQATEIPDFSPKRFA
jgi:glycine oxidase